MDQPRVQLSFFLGGRNGPQIVVRDDDPAGLLATMAALAEPDDGGESVASGLLNYVELLVAAGKIVLSDATPPPPPPQPAGQQAGGYRQGGAPWQNGGGNGGGQRRPPQQAQQGPGCPGCGGPTRVAQRTPRSGPNEGRLMNVTECVNQCGQKAKWTPANGGGNGGGQPQGGWQNGGRPRPQNNGWDEEPPF